MTPIRPILVAALLALGGCRAAPSPPPPSPVVGTPAATGAPEAAAEAPPRPLRRCFEDRPVWSDASVDELLDRAGERFDASDSAGALACAEEAARQAPDSIEAQQDRAQALLDLDRLDEAREAITLAVALAPDDPEALEVAADLYVNALPPSADRSAIGLAYARRASRHAPRRDRRLRAHLALLEGQALTDLGEAGDALRRLDVALTLDGKDVETLYSRGVALFELCRFTDARSAFERVLAREPEHAHAIYQLALIDERQGDEQAAARQLAEATRLDAEDFPPSPDVSAARFAAIVQAAVAALPDDVRRDLAGVPVEAVDMPLLEDLTADAPPLSPTILGLFRGLPLGHPDDRRAPQAARGARRERSQGTGAGGMPDRAIVLYRRNLLRTVRDEPALERAVTRTLLHEVGHLRGEDDGSLRDRGLE